MTYGASLSSLYLLRYRYRIHRKPTKSARTNMIKSFVKSNLSVREYPRILTTYLRQLVSGAQL